MAWGSEFVHKDQLRMYTTRNQHGNGFEHVLVNVKDWRSASAAPTSWANDKRGVQIMKWGDAAPR